MDISRERDLEDVFRENEELGKKLHEAPMENEELGQKLHETPMQGDHLRTQMESQEPILAYISKAQECLDNLLNMMLNDPKPDQPENNELISQLGPISDDLGTDGSLEGCLDKVRAVSELAASAEAMFKDYKQNARKEKKELENSIVSLTEENRDISTLLRSALAEKEAAEKAFSKSKGGSAAAILQIAERGLQKVGFGFRVENLAFSGGRPTTPENESNEGEEEAFSLASAMENIVKSMRHEITELRHSLEVSRDEVNHLREFSASQAQDLAKNRLRVKELEEREVALTENVEGLMKDIAVAEEDITRWRRACELEAEAGKAVMEECQAEISALKQELEETKYSLDSANSRIKLKENLVIAAMAARDAAERSLHLADRRAAAFRERIDELSRQFEEFDSRGEQNSLTKMRYACWPWCWSRITPIANFRNIRAHISADMQQLLDPPI